MFCFPNDLDLKVFQRTTQHPKPAHTGQYYRARTKENNSGTFYTAKYLYTTITLFFSTDFSFSFYRVATRGRVFQWELLDGA